MKYNIFLMNICFQLTSVQQMYAYLVANNKNEI